MLMDGFHEIMRNDKPDRSKIVYAQKTYIDALNELKSASNLDQEYAADFSNVRQSVNNDVKSYNTDNDDLIRTVEEALLIVRQDSCKKGQFKSQRSFGSIEPKKVIENPQVQKQLFPRSANSRSSKDLRNSEVDLHQNVMTNTNPRTAICVNESFGRVEEQQPQSTKNSQMKYTVEFLGKSQ